MIVIPDPLFSQAAAAAATPAVGYREHPRVWQAKCAAHQRALRATHLCQCPAVHRPARRARTDRGRCTPFARARPALFAAVVRVPSVALPVQRLVPRAPGGTDCDGGLARGVFGLSADVGGVR